MSNYFNQVDHRGPENYNSTYNIKSGMYNTEERPNFYNSEQVRGTGVYFSDRFNQNDLEDTGFNYNFDTSNLNSSSTNVNRGRTQFRPDLYETKSNRPSIEVMNMSPRAAIKAGGLRVAAKDIKSILRDLKPFISTQITELPEEVKDKFNRLAIYVQTLYNTSDYETLYAWVKQEYGHLTTTYPGTVGSYMAGCMVQTSLTGIESGCAISCAASIPPPRSDNSFNHCENTVIHGRYDNNIYHFTIFRKADHLENHRDAYLYINSTDPVKYPGFSDNEKRQLLECGVERVKIYGFNSDGRNYVELTNDLVDIANLKARNRHYDDKFNSSYHDHPLYGGPHQRPNDSGSNIWWIIVIVVIIVIIFVLGWLYYYNSNKNYAYQHWSNKDSFADQGDGFTDQGDTFNNYPWDNQQVSTNVEGNGVLPSSSSIGANSNQSLGPF